MTHSLHGWLHDERLAPPTMALTCVPQVGLEPTALGLGNARTERVWPVTCGFYGVAMGETGSTGCNWHQFAPRMVPRLDRPEVHGSVSSACLGGRRTTLSDGTAQLGDLALEALGYD